MIHCRNLLLTPILLFTLFGCDGVADTVQPLSCTLSPDSITSLGSGTAEYSVTLTGRGEVASIAYDAGSGMQTIAGPALPWSLSSEIDGDVTVRLSAFGSVEDGKLEATMTVRESSGEAEFTTSTADSCEQRR